MHPHSTSRATGLELANSAKHRLCGALARGVEEVNFEFGRQFVGQKFVEPLFEQTVRGGLANGGEGSKGRLLIANGSASERRGNLRQRRRGISLDLQSDGLLAQGRVLRFKCELDGVGKSLRFQSCQGAQSCGGNPIRSCRGNEAGWT